MRKGMPQELEVWYILPALRKELARSLIKDFNLKQREAAELLGLTEAAVSQYIKEKRASIIKFDKDIKEEIRKSAAIIKDDNSKVMQETLRLSNLKDIKNLICCMHKNQDQYLNKTCKLCFQHESIS